MLLALFSKKDFPERGEWGDRRQEIAGGNGTRREGGREKEFKRGRSQSSSVIFERGSHSVGVSQSQCVINAEE